MQKYDVKKSKLYGIVFCFLVLNILKVSIFNSIMIEDIKLPSFIYKLLITTLAMSIIYILLFAINKKRIWNLFYIIQTIYIGGAISFYDYFKLKFHLFQLATMFPEGTQVVKHCSVPLYPNMIICIMDLPLLFIFNIIYNKVNIKELIIVNKKRLLMLFTILITISQISIFANNNSLSTLSKNYPKTEDEVMLYYGSVANSVCDYVFNSNGKGLLKQFDYGDTISKKKSKDTPANIVMIQVESLDARTIHEAYNGKPIAPFLSNAADENIYNSKMMSYHLAGGTSDAEYSVINSVQPLSTFPSMKINAATYPNSLPKAFIKAGYSADVFHGNIASFYNRKAAFKQMGFQNFYDINKMGIKNVKWGASDGEVFNFADKILSKKSKPFFSYIITMTSHTPFDYVDEFEQIHDYDSIESTQIKQYYKSVHYVDEQIGIFVNSILKSKPNTYIFIYGDHTPEDLSEYPKSSCYVGKDYFEFVPLIIISPDKIKYTNNNYAVSFLDLAPTALDFSGIKYSIRSKGESLVSCKEPSSRIYFKGNDYSREDLFNSLNKGQ